jgi:hypothetical protein
MKNLTINNVILKYKAIAENWDFKIGDMSVDMYTEIIPCGIFSLIVYAN